MQAEHQKCKLVVHTEASNEHTFSKQLNNPGKGLHLQANLDLQIHTEIRSSCF